MNKIDFHSERLRFRLVETSDLHNIHSLHSLPETDKYNTLGIPNNIEETSSILETWVQENQREQIKNYTFTIEQKTNSCFLGLIALNLDAPRYRKGEVWYKFISSYWGKGYGTEALKRILDFGFVNLELHRIEAGCAVENIGSIKVLEKAGMIREGQKRQVLPLRSGWSDCFEYAIIDTDKRNSDFKN